MFSLEQNWNLVEKKFRYPLPRQLFNAAELSVNSDVHESIGIMKFNIAIDFCASNYTKVVGKTQLKMFLAYLKFITDVEKIKHFYLHLMQLCSGDSTIFLKKF